MDTLQIQNIQIDYTKLEELRKARGLSKAAVARAIGVDRRQVWQYEKGKSLPLENFTKMILFYGKPIEYFLKENKCNV